MSSVAALRLWDKASLERAKVWWLSMGVDLCGKRDAYNAVADIEQALRAK